MAECMEAAAVALATKAKASSNAADAENADPQHRFVTERRRPNRKPLEAAAREHTAAAAQEAGLTSLVQQELSSTPEPRSKPPLQITLPHPQPDCEGGGDEGAAPVAAPEEDDDEVLAAISPQLAQMQIQMQISPQQISPDVITAQMHMQMHISPLRAADLADSPFAGIAKKMRQQEAGRSREEQEARLSPMAMREGEEEAAQLALPSSPRAAQLSPPTPEQMRFSPEAAAAPAASDERPGSDAAPQQPSLLKLDLKLDLKLEQQQPSDGSRRMLRRMTRSPQIQTQLQLHHTHESQRTKRRRPGSKGGPGSKAGLVDADLREYLGLPNTLGGENAAAAAVGASASPARLMLPNNLSIQPLMAPAGSGGGSLVVALPEPVRA